MNFRAEHVIAGISLADYEALYFDEAFGEALCRHVKLSRELVSRTLQGKQLTRAVRVGPEREIPAPVAKVLGANRITYTEHIDYILGSFAGRWHTVSALLPDKVHSSGTFAFIAQGGNVRRIITGEVKVAIFGLGGLVERYIVADVEKSYAAAAEFTHVYLQDHPPPTQLHA